MRIQVNAIVVFPVYIQQEITIPDGLKEDSEEFKEALREGILDAADDVLTDGSNPLIQECESHPGIKY